jgi:ribosome maturation factor RimP
MALIELSLSRHNGSTQVRLVVCKIGAAVWEGASLEGTSPKGTSPKGISINDCSAVHRAILPRLELALPGEDLYVEVSSPGIDRLIKDKAEFRHYIGRGIRCYSRDNSDWVQGILAAAEDEKITLQGKDGSIDLFFADIAKAKLDHSVE